MSDPLQTTFSRRKALGSLAVGTAAFSASTSGSTPAYATVPRTDRPPLPPLEIIALNRMAFGLGSESLTDFQSLSGATNREKFKAYVEQQLDSDRVNDEACTAQLVPLQSLNKNVEQLWREYYRGAPQDNNDKKYKVIYQPTNETNLLP
jgi:hypothetical protein